MSHQTQTANLKGDTTVILVDNGSIRAESVESLNAIASATEAVVTARTSRNRAEELARIIPCSARWSDRAPVPGEIVTGVLQRVVESDRESVLSPAMHDNTNNSCATKQSRRNILILPLFIGPSLVVTEELPRLAARTAKTMGGKWYVSSPLVDIRVPEDNRVALAMLELAQKAGLSAGLWDGAGASIPALAICDHGSPTLAVTAVRNHVAAQVAELARASTNVATPFRDVTPCSMERRPGAEYDFCEPSLADVLRSMHGGSVVVALMFISPGRHAGAGGDIARIVETAIREASGDAPATTSGTRSSEGVYYSSRLRVAVTSLLGTHPAIPQLLAERLDDGLHALKLMSDTSNM